MLLLLFEKLTSITQNPWQMDSGNQEAPIHCASIETITYLTYPTAVSYTHLTLPTNREV